MQQQQDPVWLTTGQAARLCSVTPGTVLNWVRKGRLEGYRTAGGHYRIRRDQLTPLLAQQASHRDGATGNGHDREPLKCWEYLGRGPTPSEGCLQCVVYRLRATRCFRMAELGPEIGHAAEYCPTSCDRCSYFRRVAGLPTNVLVVSEDAELIDGLGAEAEDLTFSFAHSSYEAAAVAQDRPPGFAFVDRDASPAPVEDLLESLANDPRLPGLKLVVVLPEGGHGLPLPEETGKLVTCEIEKPFGPQEVAKVINSFPVERLEPGELETLQQPQEAISMVQNQQAGVDAIRDADGFLKELSSWDRSTAQQLAEEQDIGGLTDEHWKVIEFVQWYFNRYGHGPPVVQVHKETGMSSGDICRLFPCGMVKGAYRLAGLPRPPGCV